jgi:hypothetical protein
MDTFVPADGRDASVGKRSASRRASRERHENKTAPPARQSDVVAIESTSFPLPPVPPLPPLLRVFLIDTLAIRNDLNSNESNAEFSSNRHRSRYVRPDFFSGTRVLLAARSCQFTRHTMPSKFPRISNKTNDRHPRKVTHFFMVAPATDSPTLELRIASRSSYSTNLLSSAEALRMSRLMTSVLDKGNFFQPSEPCWAFVFKKGSQVDGKSSLGDQTGSQADAGQGSRGHGEWRSGDRASLGDRRRIHG